LPYLTAAVALVGVVAIVRRPTGRRRLRRAGKSASRRGHDVTRVLHPAATTTRRRWSFTSVRANSASWRTGFLPAPLPGRRGGRRGRREEPV